MTSRHVRCTIIAFLCVSLGITPQGNAQSIQVRAQLSGTRLPVSTIGSSANARECLAVTQRLSQEGDSVLRELAQVSGISKILYRPIVRAVTTARLAHAFSCLTKHAVRGGSPADWDAIATLYLKTRQADQARRTLEQLLQRSRGTERTAVLLRLVTEIMPEADQQHGDVTSYERYVRQLDQLGPAERMNQIRAHAAFSLPEEVALLRKASIVPPRSGMPGKGDRQPTPVHLEKTYTLARAMMIVPSTPRARRDSAAVYYVWSTRRLATWRAEHGDAAGACAMLREAIGLLPAGTSADVASALAMYDMIGRPGPALDTPYWLNLSPGMRFSLKGKVTILMYSGQGGPSPNIPDTINPGVAGMRVLDTLLNRFGTTAVQAVIVTMVPVPPATDSQVAESAAAAFEGVRPYWLNERKIVWPIAGDVRIKHADSAQQARTIAGQYKVVGFPSYYLLDKQGIVRFARSGSYPDMEVTFSNVVRRLLAEP
jgi:hypothetical protein